MEFLQRLYMCRKCCKPARKKKKTLPFTNVWIHEIKKRKILLLPNLLHWATWPPQHHSRCLPCQGTWGRISWLVWSILDSAQVWSPGLLEGHPGQVAGGHRPSISTQTRTQWVWGRGSKEKETDKTSWDGHQTMLPLHSRTKCLETPLSFSVKNMIKMFSVSTVKLKRNDRLELPFFFISSFTLTDHLLGKNLFFQMTSLGFFFF